MAVTTLTVLNKVLRGLRQFGLLIDTGTEVLTDDYLLMILQFVNEAKEEIEEAGWAWEALRQTVTVTLAQGTHSYTLTAAGDADTDTNDRSRLLYENVQSSSVGFRNSDSARPMVFDVTTSDENRLREITVERFQRLRLTDNDEQGKPTLFAVQQQSDNMQLHIWPQPDGVYTLKMRVYIPQVELSELTITATTVTIPHRPIWTRALFKANQERGEELGKEGSALHRAMLDAHASAVGNEQTPADQTVFLER